MNGTNLTSEEAEALIAGTKPDEGLEDLATVIDSLRTSQSAPLDEALVDRIVMVATRRVSDSTVDLPGGSTDQTRLLTASIRSLRRQIATVAAAVALLFASGSAVVFAADGASPGDALYGIDRALEAVGIGSGGTQERLQEVKELVAKGDVARGLEHAAVTITGVANNAGASDSDQAASAALQRAAERAREPGSAQADTTKAEVAALLDYLAGNIGHVDGQEVAELARLIGNQPATQPLDQEQHPAEPPGQSKTDGEPPGQSKSDGEPPGQSKKNVDAPGQSKTGSNNNQNRSPASQAPDSSESSSKSKQNK